jgi:hypothetical protein
MENKVQELLLEQENRLVLSVYLLVQVVEVAAYPLEEPPSYI